MNRIAFFVFAFSLAFVASAQTTPAPVEPANAPIPPVAATDADAAQSAAGKDDLSDRNCLKHTGSRIKPRADKQGRKCVSASGRSYSKEDLDRTGEADLAEALRRLDPAVH